MTAGTQDITLEVEASFRLSAIYRAPSSDGGVTPGDPIDLTGCQALMQVRPKSGTLPTGDPLISLTEVTNGGITLGGSAGTISIFITSAQTAVLTGKKAAWDIYLIFPSGDVVRLLQGAVTISPTVSVLS